MFSGGLPGNFVGPVSEDCLTVDIWAPRDAANRPVLVWICGGAFLTGGSVVETYDGRALAERHGLVVVSVNYRLGAFGFLWPGGGDPNCGLRDQLAALRWVALHIGPFGGDPGNVTVFGESAGAGSILHILPVIARERLARRAILQSAGVEHTQTAADAGRVKAAVMKAAGLTDEADLWRLPAGRLLDAQEQALPELMATVGAMPFHPVVDGDVVAGKPGVSLSAPGLDLLISWTAEEMRLYPDHAADDPARLRKRIRALIERRAGTPPDDGVVDHLLWYYGELGTGADIWAGVQTDCLMRLPARRVALSADAGAVHLAQFDWGATGGEWRRGAFHAIDLPFSFGTLDRAGWLEFLGAAGPDDRRARQVADDHMAAWAAYAATGDPGWPAIGSTADAVRRFDVTPEVTDDPLAGAAELWEGIWPADGPAM